MARTMYDEAMKVQNVAQAILAFLFLLPGFGVSTTDQSTHGCLKGPKCGHLVSALQVKLIPHTSVNSRLVKRDNCLRLRSPAGILISLNLPKKLIFGH